MLQYVILPGGGDGPCGRAAVGLTRLTDVDVDRPLSDNRCPARPGWARPGPARPGRPSLDVVVPPLTATNALAGHDVACRRSYTERD